MDGSLLGYAGQYCDRVSFWDKFALRRLDGCVGKLHRPIESELAYALPSTSILKKVLMLWFQRERRY